MRKLILAGGVVVLVVVGAWYAGVFGRSGTDTGAATGRPGGGAGGMGPMARPPMTVELAPVARADVTERLLVVGNLVGAQTVEVAPKVSGRLQSVEVRIGDPVRRGQLIALVEDQEIREQVKQAEASYQVSQATIRQREADLKFAETNLERSRSLYERQLLPRQTLDDSEARYQSALAQLDLARAQFDQSTSRLDELRITLSNTRIVSPVDGFVGRRRLDPGAFVNSNAPVVDVVDIRIVRMVVNLVERDIRRVAVGAPADVDVDAYPGEVFKGHIARVAPVLDPATRTAEMEIEVPNADYRLKPGMYARVNLTVGERQNALVVPRNALVAVDGRQGVFVPVASEPPAAAAPASGPRRGGGQVALFREVQTGVQDGEQVEVLGGLREGEVIVTTGATAVRDGDPLVVSGGQGGSRAGGNGRPAASAAQPGSAPAAR
jgi:RND family efflux transporter MFP subunit